MCGVTDYDILHTSARNNSWSTVYYVATEDKGCVVGYKKNTTLLFLGFAPVAVEDSRLRHLSMYSKECPTGETLCAGDRFRRAIEVLHSEVPVQ